MYSLPEKYKKYWNVFKNEGLPDSEIEEFFLYHEKNLRIWELYEAEALKRIQAGALRLSSKGIFEAIRERPEIQRTGEFKVCNDYTPHYSRVFITKYPQHRSLYSLKPMAVKLGQQTLFRMVA
jgi:hypothetical protein